VLLPELRPVVRRGLVRAGAAVRRTAAMAEAVALHCRSVRQPVRELSGGNQQKVVIARLLHARCSVWLLDEPTRGIDVGSRHEIYALLDAEARKGAAMLVVSSHLPELLGLCDRIAVMRRGALGPFHAAERCTQESLLHEAMFGAASAAGAVP
jgi:ribose transport system ATP-binding protein